MKSANSLSCLTNLLACVALAAVVVLLPSQAGAEDITVDTDATWPAGTYAYDNVVVSNGATLTLDGAVEISAVSLTVESGSAISAFGTGYGQAEGPGTSEQFGTGGGYGGRGGDNRGEQGGGLYGSAVQPTDLGSGAGPGGLGTGGSGGGAIKLVISGTATLAGTVSSNGSDGTGYDAGGGSGGSVLIEAGHFSGAGVITANGGNGAAGGMSAGGGGGRIAVYYATSDFSGTVTAESGSGNGNDTGQEPGTVGFFDSDDGTFRSGHSWRFHVDDSPFELTSYTLIPNAAATVEDDVVFSGASLVLESGAQLSLYEGSQRIDFELTNLSIAESALFSADGSGYGQAEGPGTSQDAGTGGGYGGRGGDNRGWPGGGIFGSALQPTDLGSGAGPGGIGTGGSGGGAISLAITGTFTLAGAISANGGDGTGYDAGGGSGGSVLIEAGHFSGAGTITANGGNGASGGSSAGGGGGRVAVYYSTSEFSGSVTTDPGSGTAQNTGQEPGTIGFVDQSTDTLHTGSTWRFELTDEQFPVDLVVPAGSIADMQSGKTYAFNAVTIENGGTLLTSDGHPAEEGPGAGLSTIFSASGGGYGGRGGNSDTTDGGEPYGSAAFPVDRGSGGGSPARGGGRGGGAMRLVVEALSVDGILASNGADGENPGAGGGSGGSLYVTTGTLSGAGSIEARGGSGAAGNDGGGGGGRIAVYHNGSTFSGTIDVSGGEGYESGEPGTALIIREIPLALGGSLDMDAEPFGFNVFRLELGAGDATNLVARLTPLEGGGEWSFVGRLNEQPGLAEYDWLPAPTASPPFSILVPSPIPGTYYFGVHFAEWAKDSVGFRIEAFSADRYVAGVDVGSGGNSGTTTVEIGGLGYETGMVVELRSGTGTALRQSVPSFFDDDSLSVSLTLQGLDPQTVDVVVVWPDESELVLEDAFEITEGTGGGQLNVRLVMNETVRTGRVNTVWIEYENVGDADLLSPILELEVLEDYVLMRPDSHSPWQSEPLQFLAISSEGQASVLSPGASNRIPVQYISDGAAHSFNTFVLSEDTSGNPPMDYDTLKPQLRPAGVSEDLWNLMWPVFTAQLGNSWNEYLETLRSDADYLSQLGVEVSNVRELIDFEMRKIGGFAPKTVLASDLDALSACGNLPVSFSRTCHNDIAGRFYNGPFGWGWTHTYDLRIVELGDGVVGVFQGGLPSHLFYLDRDGTYHASRGDYAELSQDAGGFTVSEQDGHVFTFDAGGKFASVEDRYGNTVTASYDSSDNLVQLLHSNGDAFALAYDGGGRITTLSDHAGRTTTYSYTDGHLGSVTSHAGYATQYGYDETPDSLVEHALTSITGFDGIVECFTYDDNGRLLEESLCGPTPGLALTYTYHTSGAVDVQDNEGFVVSVYPDHRGNYRRITDSAGRDVVQSYDSSDNLIELVDTEGNRFLFEYDHKGQVIRTTNPLGGQTHHSYDTLLSVPLSLTDPNNNVTRFVLDGQGGLQQVQYPDGTQESVTLDAQGSVVEYTDRAGETTAVTRNTRGQMTDRHMPEGLTESYTYDTVGRLTSATDVRGDTTTISYNDNDSAASVAYPGGVGFGYEYNQSGLLERRTGLEAHAFDYVYDSLGRLESINHDSTTLVQYQYDSLDRVVTELKGNGTYSTYAYNESGLVSEVVHYAPDDSIQQQFEYTYDLRGNPVEVVTLDGSWTYEYDAMDRLTGYTTPGGFWETYQYDAAGNRVLVANSNGAVAYSTDEMNQYTQVGTTTYTYDANGSVTSRTDSTGTTSYEYDSLNRLLRVVEDAGSTWEYTYDALGRHTTETIDGVTTYFVSDPFEPGDISVTLNESGEVQTRYIFGVGLGAQMDANGDVSYYCFDGGGNTRLLTGPDGSITEEYDYSPFGELLNTGSPKSKSAGAPDKPFLYRGMYGVLTQSHGQISSGGVQIDPKMGREMSVFLQDLNIKAQISDYRARARMLEQQAKQLEQRLSGVKATGRAALTVDKGPSRRVGDAVSLGLRAYQRYRRVRDTVDSVSRPVNRALRTYKAAKHVYRELTRDRRTTWQKIKDLPRDLSRSFWNALDISAGRMMYHGFDLSFRAGELWDWAAEKWGDLILGPDNAGLVTEEERARRRAESLLSDDPNEKVGPPGDGAQHYISGDEPFFYTVYFENKPTASAPAQEVFVTDALDSNLDLSTFRLTEIVWGEHFVEIPADADVLYSRETVPDHRPEVGKSWWVDVTVERDGSTVLWTFRTLDPDTGELPEDALAGFLPPNDDNGIGEGHVSFSIWAKPDLPRGTVIRNEAAIVFDVNDPIVTNEVFNTIGELSSGDVNGDDSINALDVQLTINEALGIATGYDCDVNGDGAVNALDVQLVINAALGIEI